MGKFKPVARVKTGVSVTAYDIMNAHGDTLRINREHMCYLVGSGQIEGVTGAIYKDTVVLKGALNELPVIKVELAPENKDTVESLVKDGRRTIGARYVGKQDMVPRDLFEQDALRGRLTNVTAQHYKGKVLIRGCKGLPVVNQ